MFAKNGGRFVKGSEKLDTLPSLLPVSTSQKGPIV
jgi:hypothetical protein